MRETLLGSSMIPAPSYFEEVRKRAEAATPTEWRSTHSGDVIQTNHITRDVWHIPRTYQDSEFIAHARQDIPILLSEIDRLQAKLKIAEGAIEEAVDGLSCAADTISMCLEEECIPTIQESASAKSYLNEANLALAAIRESSEVKTKEGDQK